jgi:hypothetical protein
MQDFDSKLALIFSTRTSGHCDCPPDLKRFLDPVVLGCFKLSQR